MRHQAFQQLYSIAERQQGCFTARQARQAGYSTQSQYYHLRSGDWERLARGIFRLRYYPRPRRLDLLSYWLWTVDNNGRAQGVFSHETALSLYPYSVLLPVKTHMTVPRGFVKRATPPGELVLYKADLKPQDVRIVEGVRVTTPIRTLADLMTCGFVAQYHLVDFIRTSLATGVITDQQLRQAALTNREWDLVLPLFEKAGLKQAHEIRDPGRIQAGA